MDTFGYGIPDTEAFPGDPCVCQADGSYDPLSDPGLIYLRPQEWDSGYVHQERITDILTDQGYSGQEIDAILGNSWNWAFPDRSRRRMSLVLGLGVWNSGMVGGKGDVEGIVDPAPGNGNGNIGASEFAYIEAAPYAFAVDRLDLNWEHWLDAMQNPDSFGYDYGHSYDGFRYCYGIKTFWNHMLAHSATRSHQDTPEFSVTPQEPIQTVKESITEFLEELQETTVNDYVALNVFADHGAHIADLRAPGDYEDVLEAIYSRQAAHAGYMTNTGESLEMAIDHLLTGDHSLGEPEGHDPRPYADKVIILLTDGRSNVGRSGSYSPEAAWQYALEEALRAADHEATIITFSIGADAHWFEECEDEDYVAENWNNRYRCGVGQSIAYLTGGEAYRIVGDPGYMFLAMTGLLAELATDWQCPVPSVLEFRKRPSAGE